MLYQPTLAECVSKVVVTAEQMAAIESRIFEAGMPVAALMEKVGQRLTQRVQALYPRMTHPRVGVIVGPGHNGGDALVMARELHFQGCEVKIFRPTEKAKDLTAHHLQYAQRLGIPVSNQVDTLQTCDWVIDGLFGFGLERPLEGAIATSVQTINNSQIPVFSIDIPSGLHTNTGEALGTAIRATHTVCLGLWKLGFLQDAALEYLGQVERLDFGIPWADVRAVLGETPKLQRVTSRSALQAIPLPRPASTHKYKMGHLLLVCGSRQYMGAATLSGLGARSSGVGMLTIAVPDTLRLHLSARIPEALVVGCPEQTNGAIAQFPEGFELDKYDAIAAGPGMTKAAKPIIQQLLETDVPLLLDADGLNILADLGPIPTCSNRSAPTILTPHLGEFKRLFPDLAQQESTTAVQTAAKKSQAIVLLKGARTAIADPGGTVSFNPESTPALARGGSGDVLTGLMGGLVAQVALRSQPLAPVVGAAAWWHSQAAILAAQERTELGVDAHILSEYLLPALVHHRSKQIPVGANGHSPLPNA